MRTFADKCMRHRPALFIITALCFIALTLLWGARSPNLWTASQMAWGYDHGPIKRGLVGAIFRLFFDKLSYDVVFYFSYGILLIELGLLLSWSYALAKKTQSFIFLLPFFVSPSLLVHVHFIGYAEHLLIILVLLIARMPVRKGAGICVALLCIIGTLIHEVFILFSLPVLCLRGLLLWRDRHRAFSAGSTHLRTLFLSLICGQLVLFFVVTEHVVLPAYKSVQFKEYVMGFADFPTREDSFGVASTDLSRNITNAVGDVDRFVEHITPIIKELTPVFLPLAAFYMALSLFVIFSCEKVRGIRKFPLYAAICIVSFSPLIAWFAAWDYLRFFALCGVTSYIGFLAVLDNMPDHKKLSQSPVVLGVSIALFIHCFTAVPNLYDGYKVIPFPFYERWEDLGMFYNETIPFPHVPGW